MPEQRRLAAVSVDLDEIPCYSAIHGLGMPGDDSRHAIYDKSIDRLANFFADVGVLATWFVIGKDVERESNAAKLKMLSRHGDELANHSLHHRYDLTKLDRASIRSEIQGGIDAIERGTGVRPKGFRAPGYTITDTVIEELTSLGVEYDSSVFPCWPYYAAKTSAIGWIKMRGRQSRSVVDDPRVLSAPADPYRVGTPYWSRGNGLLELPIGVSKDMFGRAPFIGTSVALAGETGAMWLAKSCVGRPLINFELHGIDAADAQDDGLEWLAPHQPDLRKSAKAKLAALKSAIFALKNAGYEFVTLAHAAQSFR